MVRGLLLFSLIVAVCFSVKQVNDKICDALCKRSYDGGYSSKDQCVCTTNVGDLKRFATGQISIPVETYHEPRPIVPPPVSEFRD